MNDKRHTTWQYWPIRVIWHRYRARPFDWHGWSQPISGKHGWIQHLWCIGIKFGYDK